MGGGHDHDHDGSSDEDDEDEAGRPRDLFAGGEKSGLAVQDPSQKSSDPMKLINDILAKAKAYVFPCPFGFSNPKQMLIADTLL